MSFLKGFADELTRQEEAEAAAAESEAERARLEQERRDNNFRMVEEGFDKTMSAAVENANTMAKAAVEAAKGGLLDAATVNQFREAAELGFVQVKNAADRLAISALQSGNRDVLAGYPSTDDFVRTNMKAFEAQVISAYASDPNIKSMADAQARLAEFESIMGRKPTGQERKIMLGVNIDPEVRNFLHPERGVVGVNITSPNAAEEIKRLLSEDAHAIGISVQATDLSGVALRPQEEQEWRNIQTQGLNIFSQTQRIRQQVNTDETLFTGLTGSAASFIANIADQYGQIIQASGGEYDPSLFDENGKFDFDSDQIDFSLLGGELAEKARSNAVFRFNISRLAFMLARSEDPNGRLAWQEVNLQMKMLGEMGGKMTIGAILDQVDLVTADKLQNQFDVLSASQDIQMVPRVQEMVNRHLAGNGRPDITPEAQEEEVDTGPVESLLKMIDEGKDGTAEAEAAWRKLTPAQKKRVLKAMESR